METTSDPSLPHADTSILEKMGLGNSSKPSAPEAL
jgi:hypothetical protein